MELGNLGVLYRLRLWSTSWELVAGEDKPAVVPSERDDGVERGDDIHAGCDEVSLASDNLCLVVCSWYETNGVNWQTAGPDLRPAVSLSVSARRRSCLGFP